jgi:hypothetical protein
VRFVSDPPETRFEDRLRVELLALHKELTVGGSAKVPPRRNAHRRRALSAAALVIVAAIAASLVLATDGSPRYELDAKTVAHRAHIAISFASGDYSAGKTIRTDASGATLGSSEGWNDGLTHRSESFDASGEPVQERWNSVSGSGTTASTTSLVIYFSRQSYWLKRDIPTTVAPPSAVGPDPDKQLNQLIASGAFNEIGPEEINGVQAIGLQRTVNGGTLTIWLDGSTFLPVRWIAPLFSGQSSTTDITWDAQLTAAELATLSEPAIPSGFAQVQHLLVP